MWLTSNICLLFCAFAFSIGFPEDILEYIQEIIRTNQGSKLTKEPMSLTWFINEGDEKPIIRNYLMPRLLLWDPLMQHDWFLSGKLRCPEHGTILKVEHWRCKKSVGPRWLYDSGGAIVLVMRSYMCKNKDGKNHVYLSGEETITRQLPEWIDVPFKLSHRARFLTSFQDEVVDRIVSGVNFWTIEEQIRSVAFKEYIKAQKRYCLELQGWFERHSVSSPHLHAGDFPEFDEYLKQYNPVPSNDFLRDIFLEHHVSMQQNYNCSFRSLSGSVLSCDHTFKVSVNIGAVNPTTKIWTTQYDSLFMILNEYGQVLSYEFVKSTAFDNVEPLLKNLKESMENEPRIIMLDNCCHWRTKISKIFPGSDVKLDLFHAVQRITKCISMKNIYRNHVIRDLRLVFRQNLDQGKRRTMDTPTSDIIMTNLQNFIDKGQGVKDCENNGVLSNEALKACDNLKMHIRKGCLSEIPIGAGTNRNENLHHKLNNSALGIGRIGPELAKALLCTLLYVWNCLRDRNNKHKVCYPLSSVFSELGNGMCFFGQNDLNRKKREEEQSNVEQSANNIQDPISLNSREQNIAHNTLFFASFSERMQRYNILYNLHSLLWTSHNFNQFLKGDSGENTYTSQLITNVSKLKMELVDTLKDGDCFFHAIAYALKRCLTSDAVKSKLEQLNIRFRTEAEFVLDLREAVVDEIQKNLSHYQNFMTSHDSNDLSRYRISGTFSGNNGDLMIQAMSHALSIPLCVVTGRADNEIILVECRDSAIIPEPFL